MLPSTGTGDGVLLAARAAELARPLAERQDGDTVDLLVVTAGGQQVAIPIGSVREVLPPGPVAQLPGSPGALTGLVGGHGDALAVAALAALLGLPGSVPPDQQWVIVLDHASAPLGLLADTTVDIVTVSRQELSAPAESGGLVNALLPGGDLVLDPAVLLRDPRLSLMPPDPTKEPSWPRP